MKASVIFLMLMGTISSFAQKQDSHGDSVLKAKFLDSVILYSYLNQNIIKQLPPQQGTYIFSGKKTEVINLAQSPVDIANKTGRQIFAKVPGILYMIWMVPVTR